MARTGSHAVWFGERLTIDNERANLIVQGQSSGMSTGTAGVQNILVQDVVTVHLGTVRTTDLFVTIGKTGIGASNVTLGTVSSD